METPFKSVGNAHLAAQLWCCDRRAVVEQQVRVQHCVKAAGVLAEEELDVVVAAGGHIKKSLRRLLRHKCLQLYMRWMRRGAASEGDVTQPKGPDFRLACKDLKQGEAAFR